MPPHDLVERYLYAFDWDVERIWKLPLPVTQRAIGDLIWMLDVPVWPGTDGPYTLTPRAVLEHPELYRAEHKRMMRADTAHPIDITFHVDRWVILDGVHRLLKLYATGAETVRVREVPREMLAD